MIEDLGGGVRVDVVGWAPIEADRVALCCGAHTRVLLGASGLLPEAPFVDRSRASRRVVVLAEVTEEALRGRLGNMPTVKYAPGELPEVPGLGEQSKVRSWTQRVSRIWRLRRPYVVYIRVSNFVCGVNTGWISVSTPKYSQRPGASHGYNAATRAWTVTATRDHEEVRI